MVFVELPPSGPSATNTGPTTTYAHCRVSLLVSPEAGALIRGGAGLRKLRWSAQGRGKRGGARVIYYCHVPKHHIYLIYGYVKSEREDLTPRQVKVLAELMKDLKDG
jgi:hypothetical protein